MYPITSVSEMLLKHTANPQKSNRRPYFFSVTALLSDPRFVKAAEEILTLKPFHQIAVENKFWHFTVLPLVKIEDSPVAETMEEYALRLFDESQPSIGKVTLSRPIHIQLYEWHCYDSGLCPQFKSTDGSLNEVRDNLRESLKKTHDRLASHKGVESELKERNGKNSGDRCFGSIARAMCEAYPAEIRWKQKAVEEIEIQFDEVYLLVSDEYLSNPCAHNPAKRVPIAVQS